jgi:hypothetical protein
LREGGEYAGGGQESRTLGGTIGGRSVMDLEDGVRQARERNLEAFTGRRKAFGPAVNLVWGRL